MEKRTCLTLPSSVLYQAGQAAVVGGFGFFREEAGWELAAFQVV